MILPGVTIGKHAIVGAASVVTKPASDKAKFEEIIKEHEI